MGKSNKMRINNTIAEKIITGAAVAFLTTVASTAICATAISKELIAQDGIGYCAIFTLLISALCAAMVSTTNNDKKCAKIKLMTGAIYTGGLLITNGLFFGGKYRGIPATIIVIFTGSVLAILIGRKGSKKGSGFRRKKHRR